MEVADGVRKLGVEGSEFFNRQVSAVGALVLLKLFRCELLVLLLMLQFVRELFVFDVEVAVVFHSHVFEGCFEFAHLGLSMIVVLNAVAPCEEVAPYFFKIFIGGLCFHCLLPCCDDRALVPF